MLEYNLYTLEHNLYSVRTEYLLLYNFTDFITL